MIWRIPEKFHAVDAHTHVNMMPGKDYNALRKAEALAMLDEGDKLGIEKFCWQKLQKSKLPLLIVKQRTYQHTHKFVLW